MLLIFITLTAAALNSAFKESSESALRDKLTSQIYALLAAAEVIDNKLLMPSSELDALLGLPSSGVYAYIVNSKGKILWQSSSVLGTQLPPADNLPGGNKKFNKTTINNISFYTIAYGINWLTETNKLTLTFNIATDLKSYNKQINEYQTTLWGWLLAMAFLLLLSQAAILRWGLAPLRQVGGELIKIESGHQEKIEQSYPEEIEQLTSNINQLIQQEREQKSRYRNALGDLAHSLKTPLAVLQSGLAKNKTDDSLQEQITRMNSIVEYQLQRAATAGSSSNTGLLNVKNILNRMLESLQKVYNDKSIQLNISVSENTYFKGDEGDLMELLGNLLDNAYKWANTRIDVTAEQQGNKLCLRVMDDGPGIAPNQLANLLKRGVRADENVAGHGIGFSIVCNIVDAYHGELVIVKSPMGGAEIQIIV